MPLLTLAQMSGQKQLNQAIQQEKKICFSTTRDREITLIVPSSASSYYLATVQLTQSTVHGKTVSTQPSLVHI